MRKTNADAAKAIEQETALRARAARQAATVAKAAVPIEAVMCRVLPQGADKISMGEHISGIGEVHYEKGEEFACPRDTAEAYEAKGWVEIKA